MLYTTAHLAYAEGADGISLFNFQYFRPFGAAQDLRGPFNEPPYHVINEFKKPQALAKKDQHYFLSMKHTFTGGQTRDYSMRIAPTKTVLKSDAEVRLRAHITLPGEGGYPHRNAKPAEDTSSRGKWQVWFNGVELMQTDNTGELYENPYEAGKGRPEHWLAWSVPKQAVVNGKNRVKVKLASGQEKAVLMWLEIGLPK